MQMRKGVLILTFELPEVDETKLLMTKVSVERMIKDAKNSALERVFLMYGLIGEKGQDANRYFSRIYKK